MSTISPNKLNLRKIEEIKFERGVNIDYATINRLGYYINIHIEI